MTSNSSKIQVLEISQVEVHSDYDSDRIENDIALIRLDRKAALSRESFLEYLLITIYEYLLVLWVMTYELWLSLIRCGACCTEDLGGNQFGNSTQERISVVI